MSTIDVLEVSAILGWIVAVWFALVGWKLVPLTRAPDGIRLGARNRTCDNREMCDSDAPSAPCVPS